MKRIESGQKTAFTTIATLSSLVSSFVWCVLCTCRTMLFSFHMYIKEFSKPHKTPVTQSENTTPKSLAVTQWRIHLSYCGCFYCWVAMLLLPQLEWQYILMLIKDSTLVAASLVCHLIPVKVFIMLLPTVTATPPFCFFPTFPYRLWSTSLHAATSLLLVQMEYKSSFSVTSKSVTKPIVGCSLKIVQT